MTLLEMQKKLQQLRDRERLLREKRDVVQGYLSAAEGTMASSAISSLSKEVDNTQTARRHEQQGTHRSGDWMQGPVDMPSSRMQHVVGKDADISPTCDGLHKVCLQRHVQTRDVGTHTSDVGMQTSSYASSAQTQSVYTQTAADDIYMNTTSDVSIQTPDASVDTRDAVVTTDASVQTSDGNSTMG